MSDEQPKIIIDEDWKTQVQREREQANAPSAPDGQVAASEAGEAVEFEANFESLVASLATQAMMALGVIAPQGAEQIPINLDQARFTLDTMAMLKEKTAGNLTEEEGAHLGEALTELQQVFTLRVRQFQEQALRQAGGDPESLKGGPQR